MFATQQYVLHALESICSLSPIKVMNAWKRSKAPGALEKIESILKKMEDGYAKSQTLDTRPNILSYTTVCSILRGFAYLI